jgi:hypothetical protein
MQDDAIDIEGNMITLGKMEKNLDQADNKCNTPRSNPNVNVNGNVLKLVSCLISFLYSPSMV